MNKVLIVSFVLLAICGCKGTAARKDREFPDESTLTLKEYVDYLRGAAAKIPTPEERDPFPHGPDLLANETTHYIKRDFRVVYIDERYVSFRADMEDYHGGNGNHGQVFVGTIDRITGRILGVADFVPKDKWPTLRQRLYEGAAKKVGGKQNLQGEVKVTENFYFDRVGLHFVYNPYEIACGAIGDVEVLIDLKALCSPVVASNASMVQVKPKNWSHDKE